jgi:hypothetical protein
MMMTTTGVVVVGMVDGSATRKATPKHLAAVGTIPAMAAAAGMAIPRATPKPHAAVGMSERALAAAIATMIAAACPPGTMKAGSRARGRGTMTTMTTGAVAVDMAAGTATPRAIRKPRVVVGMSVAAPAGVLATTMIAAPRAHATTKAGS